MLPAAAKHRFSLADVMPSCLAALVGSHETLDLGHPSKIVVVVVDGLGTHPLLARAGHARTLASQVTRATTIGAGFPSTTASALTTLTTGVLPGTHGMVGYAVLDAAHDRVVNQLTGWDDRLDPATKALDLLTGAKIMSVDPDRAYAQRVQATLERNPNVGRYAVPFAVNGDAESQRLVAELREVKKRIKAKRAAADLAAP